MNSVYVKYPNRIKEFSQKFGLKRKDLAVKLDLTPHQIGNYIQGTVMVSRRRAAMLCEIFGATVEELGIAVRKDFREPPPARKVRAMSTTEAIRTIAEMINYDCPLPERDDPCRSACDLVVGDKVRIKISAEEQPRWIIATVQELLPYFFRVTHDRLGYSECFSYQEYATGEKIRRIP